MSDNKLSHLDEYNNLSTEIAMYQQEAHRTWLWAMIPAATIYTWLLVNVPKIDSICVGFAWFIPPVLILLCAARYWNFINRLVKLSEYIREIEKDAFKDEVNKKLPGVRCWLLEDEKTTHKIPVRCAKALWVILFFGFALFSLALFVENFLKD